MDTAPQPEIFDRRVAAFLERLTASVHDDRPPTRPEAVERWINPFDELARTLSSSAA